MSIKVSIITITYNCADCLLSTIESVRKQSYPDIEYIIIDGMSNDGTVDLIKQNESNIDKWISEQDYGISDAFNKGIKLASGELVIFLNAGDRFVSDQIVEEAANDYLENNVDVLFYKVQVKENIYIPSNRFKDESSIIWSKAEVPHQGAFVRREVFDRIGGFNIFLKIRMDFDFFVRCYKIGVSYKYIPKVIVNYQPGGVSMKSENKHIFYREGVTVKNIYGIPLTPQDRWYFIKTYFVVRFRLYNLKKLFTIN